MVSFTCTKTPDTALIDPTNLSLNYLRMCWPGTRVGQYLLYLMRETANTPFFLWAMMAFNTQMPLLKTTYWPVWKTGFNICKNKLHVFPHQILGVLVSKDNLYPTTLPSRTTHQTNYNTHFDIFFKWVRFSWTENPPSESPHLEPNGHALVQAEHPREKKPYFIPLMYHLTNLP